MGELVDREKELVRLNKELENAENEIARAKGKLSNEGFLSKAPQNLVENEKAKLARFTELRKQLLDRLSELQ